MAAAMAACLPTVQGASGATATIAPSADAYVDAENFFTNFGSSDKLSIKLWTQNAYLKFNVSGVTGPVSQAKLRLHVDRGSGSGSDHGGTLKQVFSNNWAENTLMFFNQPSTGFTLGNLGAVTADTWVEFDVTSAVTGNGTFGFALTSNSGDKATYDSRESGSATAPQLVISDGGTTTSSTSTSTSTSSTTSSSTSSSSTSSTSSTSTSSTSTSSTSTSSTTSTTVPSGVNPILVGAGDIAVCGTGQQAATANAMTSIINANPQADVRVYTTGDNAYSNGSATDYANCYNPSWGTHKARTRPTPGNHDYGNGGLGGGQPTGYFGYFGSAAGTNGSNGQGGYYSYDIGPSWHVVALNANCSDVNVGGCNAGSAQHTWLTNDLQANTRPCTVAYWHDAYFTSSSFHPQDGAVMSQLVQVLANNRVDVVVQGHEHHYERFDPQNASRVADPNGIRAFVVGTGGTTSMYAFGAPQPNSVVRNNTTQGVLKLTLKPGGYDFEYVRAAGPAFTDSGSGSCH